MTLWFDVEDLFHHAQTGQRRMTGIQRLTLEIYRAVEQIAPERIGFVRHTGGADLFRTVSCAEIEAQFTGQEAGAPASPRPDIGPGSPAYTPRALGRALLSPLPAEVRGPLVAAAVMQLQAAGELGRFGFNLVRPRPRRPPPAPPTTTFAAAQPGDTLLALGSTWFRSDYAAIARWLRDERRMRFGMLVHDLVPIRRPEWSHAGVALTFEQWYRRVLPCCDLLLANSRHTAADLAAYGREQRMTLPDPVVLPIGSGFGGRPEPGEARKAHLPAPGRYVLFVSTLEPRKNHALAVKVWTMLRAEIQTGRRDPASVPDLVFAGGIGWLIADLLQQLENTQWLEGRIRHIPSPTDTELHALYDGCLFTVFPSFHEGWGLPVTESLAFGKPCLCSNAAALPEAGGSLCRYFDPDNLADAYGAVTSLLDDPAGLSAWQAEVHRAFRPVSWHETATALIEAADTLR